MTREINFPTASPAASDNHQQFSDLDWRMIAYLLATGGDLHPYLPKQPDWCKTIGDDVWSILQSGEPVSPRDRRRLSTAGSDGGSNGASQASRGSGTHSWSSRSGESSSVTAGRLGHAARKTASVQTILRPAHT